MMRSKFATLASLVAVALVAGACVGSSDDDRGQADLLGFLHPESASIGAVDARVVASDLGLGDADLNAEGEANRLWEAHVAVGLPIYAFPPEPPLALALDRAAIAEAVAGPPTVGLDRLAIMAVRTSQPWDEIEAALIDLGYQDRGDGVLVTEAPASQVVYPTIGRVDDVIVAGQDADNVVRAIADGQSAPGPERLGELLAAAEGPMRMAAFYGRDGGRGCGFEFAAGSTVPTTGGEWVVYVGPDPEPGRVLTDAGEVWDRRAGLRTGEPRLDGEFLRIPLIGEPPAWNPDNGVRATSLRLFLSRDGTFEPGSSIVQEYDCP